MLPRKRSVILLGILAIIRTSEQYGSGAPPVACVDQLPRHTGIEPKTTTPPYLILTSSSQVHQGDTLNVTVGSLASAPMPIGGFILQARSVQNQNTIIGQFTSVPNAKAAQIISCRSDNDTVTHTNPEEKPALTFKWKAPADFLGSVEFRATVAQSYAVFWKGVESTLVEVVTRDTVITTTVMVPTTLATTTQLPPAAVNRVKQPNAPLDVIYQGCSDTKLCFGLPENCLNTGSCTAVVAVFVAGNTYTFELQGSGNPKYVAAGLSNDKFMGDDSAMECVQNDNGRVTLHTSWTYPKVEPYVLRTDSPQNIVQLQESSVIDGKLYCKFRRDTVSVVKNKTFDLAKDKYNLMIVSGDSMKDAGRVGFHSLAFAATGSAFSLAEVGSAKADSKLLVKLHGAFMLAAWMAAASIGILLARYFRQTWVGKQLGGKDIWFAYHRILMVGTWLLTVVGFIIVVVEAGGLYTTGDNPHAITGYITIVLCFIQPIGAYFRPHPGTPRRAAFNWLHWLGGNAAHILALTTIFLSVYLSKAELAAWSVFVPTAFVVFHVLMHVLLSLTVCVSEGRISNGRVNSFPMKDLHGHTRQTTQVDRSIDAPFSGFRKLLLWIYAPVVILLTVAMICLVALAPFEQTFNTIMNS